MNKILEVFETSGKEVFTSKNKRNIFKQDSKPWYTNKSFEYRNKIHRARKNEPCLQIITFVIIPLDRFRLLCRSGVFCVLFLLTSF
jgi:hypothetical protein